MFTNTSLNDAAESKTPIYSCHLCFFTSKREKHFQCHMNAHSAENYFECEFCDYKSVKKSSVAYHKVTHTKEKKFPCDFCHYAAAQSSNLTQHVHNVHKDKKEYECPQCNYKTIQNNLLLKHMSLHAEKKELQCKNCNFQTTSSSAMEKHMITIHNIFEVNSTDDVSENTTIQCEQCDFTTSDFKTLKKHIDNVHKTKHEYQCEQCEYKTNAKYHFARHYQIHTREKTFHCALCDYKAAFKSYIKRHYKIHHTNALKCNFCDFISENKIELMAHTSIHSGENYNCSSKLSENNGNLIPVLENNMPPCLNDLYKLKSDVENNQQKTFDYNDAQFGFKSLLNEDVLKCDKMFKCSQCNYTAENQQNFEMHTCKTNDKEFQCDRCDFKTVVENDLKHHQKSHFATSLNQPNSSNNDYKLGQKVISSNNFLKSGNLHPPKIESNLFYCDHCNYKTPIEYDLFWHMNNHTVEKQYYFSSDSLLQYPENFNSLYSYNQIYPKVKPFYENVYNSQSFLLQNHNYKSSDKQLEKQLPIIYPPDMYIPGIEKFKMIQN